MRGGTIELAARALQLRKPGEGLTAVAALRSHLDMLEGVHVDNALRSGWTWSRIAEALGVTKQAAHKKHARRVSAGNGRAAGATPERLLVTAEARRSVFFARREARAAGAAEVGTDHLLLGLLYDAHGPASRALAGCGVSLSTARRHLGSGARAVGENERPAISPEARTVLEQSLREAVSLRDGHLGVEHVLLALLVDESGRAAEVLRALDAPPAAVRDRLTTILEEPTLVFQRDGTG